MARALILVDFQNDFTPGGALGVEGGDEVSARLNELAIAGGFDLVVATRDWHPPDHDSFHPQGGTWPEHAVAQTPGAELHPALDRTRIDLVVDKGTESGTDGYSAFDGTDLAETLRHHDVDEVVVAGLATDYCVKHTALDALDAGFAVTVEAAATRPVEREPGDGERALQEIRDAGGCVR